MTQEHRFERPLNTSSVRRFLALGDSYTIGEGVAPSQRWPSRLAVLLRAQGVQVGEPSIVARTGWTADELAAGIAEARPGGAFDLVTLAIGVNDQFRGRTAADYRAHFDLLLTQAIGYANGDPGHVIVLSIPDWGVTPFAAGRDAERIAREIDAFNAVDRVAARSAGAHVVDITTMSRNVASDPNALAADGLHPSGAMHDAWARAVLPVAAKILAAP